MAKTSFTNGSFLTPTFVNTLYGNGADTGHLHDGVDQDGHCSKIDLSNSAHVTGKLPSTNVDMVLRNYLDGFTTSYNISTNAWSITIQPGYCMDSANTYSINLTSAMTKNIIGASGLAKVNWAAGTGQGGVPSTGSVPVTAGTWLHVFIIAPVVSGSIVTTAIDAGVDVSPTAAYLTAEAASVTAYSVWAYRRVGSILTKDLGSSFIGIEKFIQVNDVFTWETAQTVLNTTVSLAGTIDTITCVSPPDVNCQVNLVSYIAAVGATNTIRLWSGLYPTSQNGGIGLGTPYVTNTFSQQSISLITGTTKNIYAQRALVGSNPSLFLSEHSYKDFRGRQ